MKPKLAAAALIFDVDGTLWDSRALVAEAWSRAVSREMHKPILITAEQLTPLFGKPMPEIFSALFPGQSADAYEQIAEACQQAEEETLKEKSGILYPGVAETVPLLSERFPLYIVSNCQCGYIEAFLQRSGLAPYFRDWLCYGDTKKSKGETILTLMERAGLSAVGEASHDNMKKAASDVSEAARPKAAGAFPERFPAVYLGDTLGDALACRAARIPFVWAAYGFGAVDASAYKARIDAFPELSSLFLN